MMLMKAKNDRLRKDGIIQKAYDKFNWDGDYKQMRFIQDYAVTA